jgi:predicted RNase H-like nuclease (RuvC/YqgF family)
LSKEHPEAVDKIKELISNVDNYKDINKNIKAVENYGKALENIKAILNQVNNELSRMEKLRGLETKADSLENFEKEAELRKQNISLLKAQLELEKAEGSRLQKEDKDVKEAKEALSIDAEITADNYTEIL